MLEHILASFCTLTLGCFIETNEFNCYIWPVGYSHLYSSHMNHSSELHIYSTIYLTYVLINFKVPENSDVWNWDLYFTPLPCQRDPLPVLTNSWMLSTCTWNSEIQEPLSHYIFPYFYTQCTVKWRYDYPSWIHVLLFIFVSSQLSPRSLQQLKSVVSKLFL